MTSTKLDELQAFDQKCQTVMVAFIDSEDADVLRQAIEAFADSGNVYILRGLSFRLADSDISAEINALALVMIERGATQDMNTLSNLLTALARLEQKDVEWKTPQNLKTAQKLLNLCKSVSQMLAEDAEDFEHTYLTV